MGVVRMIGKWAAGVLLWMLLVVPVMATEHAPSELVIVGSRDYAPFYFMDANDRVAGIFVDIWQLWSQKTGVAVKFQTMAFADALKAVAEGRSDVVAGFFYSPERAGVFDYSIPFYEIPTHLFFNEKLYGLKSLEDLSGFNIGVVRGDYAETFLKQHLPSARPVPFDGYNDLIDAAMDERIEVFICDTPVARFLLGKDNRGNRFRHTLEPLYSSKIFAGVQKGRKALMSNIDAGFKAIDPSHIRRLEKHWQGQPQSANRSFFSWRLAIGVLAALLASAAALLLWNYQLRRRVEAATADLKRQRGQLKSSEARLQQVNEELEDRVTRRTAELQQANELLEAQVVEYARAEKKLERHNAYLSALHTTMLGVIRRLDLDDLLAAIIDGALDATGVEHAFIYLEDEKTGELVVRAGRGQYQRQAGYRIRPGDGLAGKVFATGQHLLVEDYPNWEGRHPDRYWHNIQSLAGIPLKSGDRTVGVIGLARLDRKTQFTDEDMDFLVGFSELASIAFDNARLYADLQQQLADRQRGEQQRRQLEERIRQAHKMEAIGTLAGGIAHDFNNILASILGYTELAMGRLDADSKLGQYMANVHRAGIRARDLVQQILAFSRKGEQQTRPLILTPIVKETIKLIRASIPSNIDIKPKINVIDAVVQADPVQIHQVLMNLSANAAYAMEQDGGSLTITVNLADLDPAFCDLHPEATPGRHVQLTVSDTGPGIDPSLMPRIFDPYFTTKEMGRGTGLGLAVVHGIVQRHGGVVVADSRPGQGASFHIYLPVCDAETAVEAQPAVPPRGGSEQILFVDDEPDLRDIGRQMLTHLGYRVTTCRTGQEALDVFNQDPSAFDLVITDMTMPNLTGDKLAAELLSRRPNLPIIICTGFSHHITAEKAAELGVRQLVMKPLVVNVMADAIREALTGPTN